jgi:hypothetical protein
MALGLVGSLTILFSSACASLDNGAQQPRQRSTAGQRVERFAKSMTKTVADLTSDVLPILTAATHEAVDEIKSDLPKVTEELNGQMSHIISSRGSRDPGH